MTAGHPPGAVLVAIGADPETSHRANEAVRIALGIVAGENEVAIALLGPAARILAAGAEDLVDGEDTQKHLATLKKLGQRLLVERDAISPEAGWNPLGIPVDPLDRAGLADLMAESRRVLVF
jgi:hypothetical protein